MKEPEDLTRSPKTWLTPNPRSTNGSAILLLSSAPPSFKPIYQPVQLNGLTTGAFTGISAAKAGAPQNAAAAMLPMRIFFIEAPKDSIKPVLGLRLEGNHTQMNGAKSCIYVIL